MAASRNTRVNEHEGNNTAHNSQCTSPLRFKTYAIRRQVRTLEMIPVLVDLDGRMGQAGRPAGSIDLLFRN